LTSTVRAHNRSYAGALFIGLWLAPGILFAQGMTVTGHAILIAPADRGNAADNSNAVVWLTPLNPSIGSPDAHAETASSRYRLVQKNKRFTPHVLVVPVGAVVEFPNYDPFFHNVFSLFDGKRFDLGLYEAGTTRKVSFNSPGFSYIFCNIHPEMAAVVFATKTPYYAISNAAGEIAIPNVPAGRYQLNVWSERSFPDALKSLSREVMVSSSSSSLGELRLPQSADLLSNHKNKYGRDYDPTAPSNPIYDQP